MDQSRSQHESELSVAERAVELTVLCERFDQEWASGDATPIESWLEMAPPEQRGLLLCRLLGIELAHRTLRGETPHPGEYAGRFPEYREFVESQFRWLMTATHVDSHAGTKCSTAIFGKIAHAINPETRREPGHIVGRYQLQELVGCGGFGEVWRAYDPQLSRTVAIKLLRPDRKFPDDMFENLRAEARRVASLTHRNIVPVYDIAEDDGGVYIVSEFIPGKTLADRINRARPTIAESVGIAVQVADALHHAHLAGFIHRDVKPSNILLRDNGEAVLADFGLATSEADQLHEDGGAMGTWKYMSPEQARGESNRCDARTDVYSLGVVLFELLTGRLPYVGDEPPAYIEQILSREPRLPRTINDAIPPELERLCLLCLAKAPGERFTTCAELAEALRRFQATQIVPGANSSTQPLSAPTPQFAAAMSVPRQTSNSRAVAGLILVVSLSAGLIGTIAFVSLPALFGARERVIQQQQNPPNPPGTTDNPPPGGADPGTDLALVPAGDQGRARSPSDRNWRQLLTVEPTIVSWRRGEGREQPVFNPVAHSYSVRSDVTDWIATTGQMNGLGFELRAGVEVEDGIGMAGLVWCFQQDEEAFPEKKWKCLTVEISRWNATDPYRLKVRKHSIDILAYDDWQITSSATVDQIDVEPPSTTPASLEVTVNDGKLLVRYDGHEWAPTDVLNEAVISTKGDGAVGLIGCGRQVTFTDFAVRNLD